MQCIGPSYSNHQFIFATLYCSSSIQITFQRFCFTHTRFIVYSNESIGFPNRKAFSYVVYGYGLFIGVKISKVKISIFASNTTVLGYIREVN